MIKKIVLVTLVVAASTAIAGDDMYRQFIEWGRTHGKEYDNAYENVKRFQTWKTNVALINHFNRQNRGVFELNQFADLSIEEFGAQYLRPYPAAAVGFQRTEDMTLAYNPRVWYPKEKNWADDGAVTPIKNQGQCGSCWAFSATGNMEGVTQIKTGKLPSISEQQLVDCEHDCMIYPGTTQEVCDEGCNGGLMPNAFTYAIREGMTTEEEYPYSGKDQTCKKFTPTYSFSDWKFVEDNEDAMVAAINDIGPVSVAVDATYWSFYSKGIYDGSCTTTRLNHGVLLIGYGIEGSTEYWIIKNSWGTSWGEQGFMRLARGKNKCGINEFVCTLIP